MNFSSDSKFMTLCTRLVELCKINKNAHTGLYPFADAARTPHGDSNMSNLPITLI